MELYVGRLVLHSCIIIRLSLAPKGHAIFNASLESVKDALFPFCQYFVNYAFEMKLYCGILLCTCSSSNIDTVWVNWMTYLCKNKWSIHLVNQKMSYSLDGNKVIIFPQILFNFKNLSQFVKKISSTILSLELFSSKDFYFIFRSYWCGVQLHSHLGVYIWGIV